MGDEMNFSDCNIYPYMFEDCVSSKFNVRRGIELRSNCHPAHSLQGVFISKKPIAEDEGFVCGVGHRRIVVNEHHKDEFERRYDGKFVPFTRD